MINAEELAICRRRGHPGSQREPNKWRQCPSCGMWLREVVTTEEREHDPPPGEIDLLDQLVQKNRRPIA